jgi:hypothetical protein
MPPDRFAGLHVVVALGRNGEVDEMAMMPTTDRSICAMRSAGSAPTPADGSVERIIRGWMKLSYNMPRMMQTTTSAAPISAGGRRRAVFFFK